MAKYYNPKQHSVSITGKDGGRLTLPPVIPGRQPKTVEGDYYEKLVSMGILAKWTDEVAKSNKKEFLAKALHKFRKPAPVKAAPKPAPPKVEAKVEEEAPKEAKFSAEALEESTVNELKALIELHDMGELPKEVTKKADIIQFIIENQK